MVRPLSALRAFCSTTPPFWILVFALMCPLTLAAQELPAAATAAEPPAHIAFVDGVAVLERDGQIDNAPTSMPLLAGDRVRTRGGRVEILFGDGATLHLDHNTVIDLQSDELVRLIEGRIRLSIPGPQRTVGYRVDGAHGWALIDEPGEYRVALLNAPNGSEMELSVIRGRAELANDGGRTPLRAGERAFVRAAAAPSYAFVANSAALDAFDRWSEMRRNERLSASAQYLPDEVRAYAAVLDRDGYWSDEPTYGRVWYPRVGGDWRPYYRGRWSNLRPYGWTWVGYDPWGWPTHHYGRWGFGGAGWFWIPGRSWGAAWVSWASAPGYVSWCPLGWNNRPVFQINVGYGGYGGYRYDPWRAWTVLPYRSFGHGYVHRNVVRVDHLDTRIRGSFRVAERAPLPESYVGPRATTAIRSAGSTSGRRPSPVYSNLPADQGRMRTEGQRIEVPAGNPARRAVAPSATEAPRERTTPSRTATRSTRPAGAAPGGVEVLRGRVPADRSAADRSFSARPSNDPPASEPRRAVAPAASSVRSLDGARPSPAEPRSYGVQRVAPREAPRQEPRPAAVEPGRAPEVQRRAGGGIERPSAGSYQRQVPSAAPAPAGHAPAAQPSSAPRSGGDRPAAAPAGARPRTAGGGATGGATGAPARRAGGGRTGGQ